MHRCDNCGTTIRDGACPSCGLLRVTDRQKQVYGRTKAFLRHPLAPFVLGAVFTSMVFILGKQLPARFYAHRVRTAPESFVAVLPYVLTHYIYVPVYRRTLIDPSSVQVSPVDEAVEWIPLLLIVRNKSEDLLTIDAVLINSRPVLVAGRVNNKPHSELPNSGGADYTNTFFYVALPSEAATIDAFSQGLHFARTTSPSIEKKLRPDVYRDLVGTDPGWRSEFSAARVHYEISSGDTDEVLLLIDAGLADSGKQYEISVVLVGHLRGHRMEIPVVGYRLMSNVTVGGTEEEKHLLGRLPSFISPDGDTLILSRPDPGRSLLAASEVLELAKLAARQQGFEPRQLPVPTIHFIERYKEWKVHFLSVAPDGEEEEVVVTVSDEKRAVSDVRVVNPVEG